MVKQVFAPYTDWEDWKNGMFRNVNRSEFNEFIQLAFRLLSDPEDLIVEMRLAVAEWPTSAAVNLTDTCVNHRPWLGQSACCIAHGCPEDATRQAWALLDSESQRLANNAADIVFEEYKRSIESERQLWLNLEWR